MPRAGRPGRGRPRRHAARVAVPAAAGIPVTHRGVSRQFTVVSGHDGANDSADRLDDPRRRPEGTLVVLMGVGRLAEARRRAGRPRPATRRPRSRSSSAARCPTQRTTVGTLGTIVDPRPQRGEVTSPAVVVVGDVAALADVLGAGPGSADRSR